jgi:hypothetical protein
MSRQVRRRQSQRPRHCKTPPPVVMSW